MGGETIPRVLQFKGQGSLTERRRDPGALQQPPGPEQGSRQDFWKGNLEQGHPRAKGTLLARRILAAQPPSPRISRMSTNPDHKVKLSGPPLSRWVAALCLGARRGDRCGAGAPEGTPAHSPNDCVIGPGGGARDQPHARMRRRGPGTLAACAVPGGMGGDGKTVVPPPGTAPGRQGEPRG